MSAMATTTEMEITKIIMVSEKEFVWYPAMKIIRIITVPGGWDGAEMREVLSHADADTDITTSLSSASISSRGGIHTGNIHLLHRIKDLEASKIMLQTRLDADDGLHLKYLEHIQKDALERFVVPAAVPVPVPAADTAPADTKLTTATSIHPSSTKWFYWCSGIHVKWYLDGEGEHGQLHTEKIHNFASLLD